jgi:tetratricopeptide (TPR) repeat protein
MTSQVSTGTKKELELALLHHQAGSFSKAKALYEKILIAEPSNPEALHLSAILACQSGGFIESESFFALAVKTKTDSAKLFYDHGLVLKALGRYVDAIAGFNKAIYLEPNHFEAYFERGNALAGLGSLEEALLSYQIAINIKSDFIEAISNRGLLLADLNFLEEAIGEFEKAILINPENSELFFNLGNTFEKTMQYEKALHSYEMAITLKPEYADAYCNRGNVWANLDAPQLAISSYDQAIAIKTDFAEAYSNRGNALMQVGRFADARSSYQAALAVDAGFALAHQGMARALAELGDPESDHGEKGFIGHAVYKRAYRGSGMGLPVLLLVCARGGNVPVERWVDDKIFNVTTLYPEFFDPADRLPPHQIIVNAIGDPDLSQVSLVRAEKIIEHATSAVINAPSFVLLTGRSGNAKRLSKIEGVITPKMKEYSKSSLMTEKNLVFPFLLRAPGFHEGRNFVRVDERSGLELAAAQVAGRELLSIEYFDTRGADGFWRKYRVMIIDGCLYPLHLAVSPSWKVHYFSSSMRDHPEHRAEEKKFLDDMTTVLGPAAMLVLAKMATVLGLDYCGVDFALAPDGRVQVFEANATMVISSPQPDQIWDYRRPAIDRALLAATTMLLSRAERLKGH